MGNYFRLISYLNQVKTETVIRVLLGLGIVACGFSQALFLAKAVTAVMEKQSLQNTMIWFAADLFALILRALLIRLQESFLKRFAAKIKANIRQQ